METPGRCPRDPEKYEEESRELMVSAAKSHNKVDAGCFSVRESSCNTGCTGGGREGLLEFWLLTWAFCGGGILWEFV